MKIFIDSANLNDIEEALKRGFASGITTNPMLLAKEPKSSFELHVNKIIDLINTYQPGIPLSVEVFSKDPDEMMNQAKEFVERFNYTNISIKIQIGWNELAVIKTLSDQGISVNCTACMDVTQAIMAAKAGAKYVSLFWGRIRDGGLDGATTAQRDALRANRVLDYSDFNPATVVRSVRQLLDESQSRAEIIVGSIRGIVDIRDAALAGAHIVTVPPKFFPDMANHFKTDEVIEQFLAAFKEWLS
jgi:transaldolase